MKTTFKSFTGHFMHLLAILCLKKLAKLWFYAQFNVQLCSLLYVDLHNLKFIFHN